MDSFKSQLVFTRGQRTGLLVLLSLIFLVQIGYHLVNVPTAEPDLPEKKQWLALQRQIDSVRKLEPVQIRYPFNPNFITDHKGYRLGMSVEEIDRLHAFRKQGRYVNSAREFQDVTKISDSLLAVIAPDFKFPDWVIKKQTADARGQKAEGRWKKVEKKFVVKDINLATKEELMAIYGIGDALSDRILKQKETLGGFVSMAQMEDIWGLSPEVVDKLKERFVVKTVPVVNKIRINDASISTLAKFPYFRYALAKEIVTARSMAGPITGVADLTKIKNFPIEKVEIIAVYLEF